MKHTHKGHCQVCGRIQAASEGNHMPKHGYRVADFGYFVGTCQGTSYAPLEQSRQRCDDILAALSVFAAEQEVLADSPRATATVRTDRSAWNPETHKRETICIPWEDATVYQRSAEMERIRYFHASQARGARAHIKDMKALAQRVNGQPLMPAQQKPAQVQITEGMTFVRNGTTWTVRRRWRHGWEANAAQYERIQYFSAGAIRECVKNCKE